MGSACCPEALHPQDTCGRCSKHAGSPPGPAQSFRELKARLPAEQVRVLGGDSHTHQLSNRESKPSLGYAPSFGANLLGLLFFSILTHAIIH